ncbi:unnamed protein product [Phytomonas sp. Hart1]|nr:unnamed protein product [Phytomonas sp. Hart1]|eukprot:CCW67256.1 unnamed protein product [Phytomonas sp. isolate Hart1]
MWRLVDVFGKEAPDWVSARFRKKLATAVPALECRTYEYFTTRQERQLGTCLRLDEGEATGSTVHPSFFARPYSLSSSSLTLACLAHGRVCCFISPTRGDIASEVDQNAPFLSCRGLALTREKETLERLNAIQKAKVYDSPFWLSDVDYRHYSLQTYLKEKLRFKFMDSTTSFELFNSDVSVEMVNDRGSICRVVNLEEIQEVSHSEILGRSFYIFRQFTPLNVRTGEPFEHSIEDHLRLESAASNFWCSVWGTLQDFEACSIKPLKGALGLHLMDSMGNEVFLTNAFCTENPFGAFSRVYPDRFIIFTE